MQRGWRALLITGVFVTLATGFTVAMAATMHFLTRPQAPATSSEITPAAASDPSVAPFSGSAQAGADPASTDKTGPSNVASDAPESGSKKGGPDSPRDEDEPSNTEPPTAARPAEKDDKAKEPKDDKAKEPKDDKAKEPKDDKAKEPKEKEPKDDKKKEPKEKSDNGKGNGGTPGNGKGKNKD